MRKVLLFGLLLISALLMAACSGGGPGSGNIQGSGNIVSETREVPAYNQIDVIGTGNLNLTITSPPNLTITADDNVMQYISTEVIGTSLQIRLNAPEGGSVAPSQPISYAVSIPFLRVITASGNATVTTDVATIPSDFDVQVSDDAQVTLTNFEADSITITAVGNSQVTLSGSTSDFSATLEGSARMEGGDMEVALADITTRGSAQATIWVTENIDAFVYDNSIVNYYGEPSGVNPQADQSAQFNALGPKQ
ncbi:MAG: hypothetical protein GYB68_05370 [Chloroflexi bacterium]|nr:hypothetical protein [Chloroflexota bacterium]